MRRFSTARPRSASSATDYCTASYSASHMIRSAETSAKTRQRTNLSRVEAARSSTDDSGPVYTARVSWDRISMQIQDKRSIYRQAATTEIKPARVLLPLRKCPKTACRAVRRRSMLSSDDLRFESEVTVYKCQNQLSSSKRTICEPIASIH